MRSHTTSRLSEICVIASVGHLQSSEFRFQLDKSEHNIQNIKDKKCFTSDRYKASEVKVKAEERPAHGIHLRMCRPT